MFFHLPIVAVIFAITGGLVGAVMLAAALRGWGWHDPSRPVEFTIGWDGLENVKANDDTDFLEILVRLPEGKRLIFFKPTMNSDSLLAELRRKGKSEA